MATTRKACFEGTPEYDKCLEDAVAYAKHKNMAVDVQSVYKLIHGVILMGDQGHAQRTYVFKDKRIQKARSTLSLLDWASTANGGRYLIPPTDAEELGAGDHKTAPPKTAAPVVSSAQTTSSSEGISSSTARTERGAADAACSDAADAVAKVVAGSSFAKVAASGSLNDQVASTLVPSGVGCPPMETPLLLSGILAGLALASGEHAEKDREATQAAMAEEDTPERYKDSQRQADVMTQAIAELQANQQPTGMLAGPAQADVWRQELGAAAGEGRALQQAYDDVADTTQDILQQQQQEQDPGEEDVVSN